MDKHLRASVDEKKANEQGTVAIAGRELQKIAAWVNN